MLLQQPLKADDIMTSASQQITLQELKGHVSARGKGRPEAKQTGPGKEKQEEQIREYKE